jgi:hypothetical protein
MARAGSKGLEATWLARPDIQAVTFIRLVASLLAAWAD